MFAHGNGALPFVDSPIFGDYLMNRNAAFAALAGLVLWTTALQAQQAFTIKLKETAEGETIFVKKSENTSTKVTIADGDGKVLVDQRESKTEIQEYKETILNREAGKSATKRQREYSKVQSGKDDKLEDGALQGKTVIIEQKADQFMFTYKDGEAVVGAAKAALLKDFNRKKAIPTPNSKNWSCPKKQSRSAIAGKSKCL